MSRRVVWLQLLIGWLPLWGLVTAMVVIAHGTNHLAAGFIALRMIVTAALAGVFVQRLTERYPWQTPVRVSFMLVHLGFAILYSVAWLIMNSLVESVKHAGIVLAGGPSIWLFLVTGIWFYVMVAGVSYTAKATERAASAESIAAKSQLAALRAQLNPHFLFNALHSVVQLIPVEPKRAAQAAEQVAALLRTTIEEDRELVSVGEELAFVERYMALERMRFGDRLRLQVDVPDPVRAAELPVFALQTLVENAVRHGAAPRIEPTEVTIRSTLAKGTLTLVVSDDGEGDPARYSESGVGSGLRRLRERLKALYGDAGHLRTTSATPGFVATLTIPQARASS